MKSVKHTAKKVADKFKDDQEAGARKTLLEELFNDFHRQRKDVYKMNFIRGIFFGLGSALGGTIVLAIVVWVLLQIPGVNSFIKSTQDSVNRETPINSVRMIE